MNEWEKHEGFMPWIYVDDDIYISVDAYKLVHIHLSKLEDDYAFVDGHHDELATLSYFEQILPFMTESSIIVFDDISWSRGMERAWNAIIENESIKASVNLFKLGICVLGKPVAGKHSFKIAI